MEKYVVIPQQFFEQHFLGINYRELRIYLFLRSQRALYHPSNRFTCKEISQGLAMNPTDVGEGLRKLGERGLVKVVFRSCGWIKYAELK